MKKMQEKEVRCFFATVVLVLMCLSSVDAAFLVDTPSTVGLWQMDEISGSAVPDANPLRGNDLAVYGNVTVVAGFEGGALSFDGDGDYGMADVWGNHSSVMIDIIFKPNSTAVAQYLVDARGIFTLNIASGGKLMWGISGVNLKNNFAVNTTDWWHASAVIDTAGDTSLTVTNLSTLASSTVTGSSVLSQDYTRNIIVGAWKDGAEGYFDGQIDAVRVAVPEPATLSLFVVSSLALLKKRSKR